MTDSSDAIVLIHGLWMHGIVMEPLRHRLQNRHGYVVHNFSYPSVTQGINANVARLRDFVSQVTAPQVHLVGHSLGGVLALKVSAGMPTETPGRVVCMGAPLRGTSIGRAVSKLPAGDWIIGQTIRDAVLEAPFESYEGDRDVGVIAGTVSIGTGLLLPGALEGPNDGVVTVAETRLPGITDHVEMRHTHWTMVMSRRAADQVAAFLRNGCFNKKSQGRDSDPIDQA
ncbi:MAG: alpha/beta hydrolase [Gammaproteobacteria bacterium]|nr:alpha/beta hydrolase [Gammaproteobacteria bacterium]